ncbi:DNA-binding transcriptional regulator [Magnetospirillum sp. SS-4]|uniref:helix-turn-helix domain-containing protein n=1 Tax=Magnetospirillum sp. SS-4 TaxID=2681465 RepID=UPI001380B524|nr:helix-turn-helix domain-containing protein [Magnetospirillum sp. SS-4]CAA7626645.1 conserved hypothetical protein [Magnetospirillum sp. SS-4]
MPIVRSTREEGRRKAKSFDWSKVDATTDEDIARQVAEDPDLAPLMTAEQILDDVRTGRVRVVVPAEVDVRAVRQALGLSQEVFAAKFGFSLGSLRNWEQGRRQPDGPARVLLKVIAKEPEAVRRALSME